MHNSAGHITGAAQLPLEQLLLEAPDYLFIDRPPRDDAPLAHALLQHPALAAPPERLRPGDGPAERLKVPRQGCVPFRLALRIQLTHLVDHRLGDRIRFKPQRLGTLEALRRRLAVVGIEIPLPTEGLSGLARAFHQHAEAATTFPVKQLQA